MLVDQRIAVIGGTGGIGFAVAAAALDCAAEVIVGSSSPEKLEHTLKKLPAEATGFVVDVTNEDSVRKFFDQTGEISHVAVTVGISYKPTPVSEADLAENRKPFLVKYWGQFLVAKYAVAKLSERGSITLTSGVLSQRPAKGLAAQSSVNAAVEALARTLAIEIAPCRVNAVSPGFIDTGKLLANLSPEDRTAKLLETKGHPLPAQRVGKPQDAASAYLYAMQNPYLTGQVLVVDGGDSIV